MTKEKEIENFGEIFVIICMYFYLLFFQMQLKYILQVQYIFLDLNVNWFENSEYYIRNIEDIISNCPDGTYYGMVMSVRASIRVSVRPSDSPFRSSAARFINFFLHALTYWTEILHMYYRSSSSVVTLRESLKELCPFWNLEYWKYTFLLHALKYWGEILYLTFISWTWDKVSVSSIFVGVMPL